MIKILIYILVLFSFSFSQKPIVLNPNYEHDKWKTLPQDNVIQFAAYTTSFDGKDDNNGDNDSDIWGIPEWVSFEIKKVTTEHNLDERPTWFTVDSLFDKGIAPKNKSYHVAGTQDMGEVKLDYRFVRGHMCPKNTAERISSDAAYNTHCFVNSVPQLQWQNNQVWKKIEELCEKWADDYNRIWVICGPVFFKKNPAMWLGQQGEFKVAIPDALFKIVIREENNSVKTLSFLIPNILPKEEQDPVKHLTTIRRIEELTGLNFLTVLSQNQQDSIETLVISDIDL